MRRANRLVHYHLEHVSKKLLVDYADQLRTLIGAHGGVYVLYRQEKLYYVGQAKRLISRLRNHLRDKHKKQWTHFSLYVTGRTEHTKELESLALRIAYPTGNRVRGKFHRSHELHADLNQLISDHHAQQRAALLGGKVARRLRRKRAATNRGASALVGAVPRAIRLIGMRSGYEYKGSLRTDGRIQYGGKLFESPQAAAQAAVGRRVNGWQFWYFRDRRGEWVQLRELKK